MESQSHKWLKSYGSFTEGVDFAYWWSCIKKGLRPKLKPTIYSTSFNCCFVHFFDKFDVLNPGDLSIDSFLDYMFWSACSVRQVGSHNIACPHNPCLLHVIVDPSFKKNIHKKSNFVQQTERDRPIIFPRFLHDQSVK